MKEIIAQIDRTFENKVRLGIMSALMVKDSIDFVSLRELLGVTDGNLSSNLTMLEKSRYLSSRKRFVGKKPRTTYSVTAAGRRAFSAHLSALEQLIHDIGN